MKLLVLLLATSVSAARKKTAPAPAPAPAPVPPPQAATLRHQVIAHYAFLTSQARTAAGLLAPLLARFVAASPFHKSLAEAAQAAATSLSSPWVSATALLVALAALHLSRAPVKVWSKTLLFGSVVNAVGIHSLLSVVAAVAASALFAASQALSRPFAFLCTALVFHQAITRKPRHPPLLAVLLPEPQLDRPAEIKPAPEPVAKPVRASLGGPKASAGPSTPTATKLAARVTPPPAK
jgi:hypothetical protein